MWMRIGSRYPMASVPDVLVSVCLHGTGSFRNADKMERNQWKVYESAIARWPDVLDARTRRHMRALILADAGGEYLFGRDYKMASRRFLAALRHDPMEPRRWYTAMRVLLKRLKTAWRPSVRP
jgi:hypothetical protein